MFDPRPHPGSLGWGLSFGGIMPGHQNIGPPGFADRERRQEGNEAQRRVMAAVFEEREYQRQRWGAPHDKQHTRTDWLVILNVWMGKVAEHVPPYVASEDKGSLRSYRKRLVQTAAICLAALEAIEEP